VAAVQLAPEPRLPPVSPAAESLAALDRAWLRMDDPTNLMMITGVLVFDGPVDLDTLREAIARRLVPLRRFRERIVEDDGGRPVWQNAADFDLTAHVQRLVLPEPGGEPELREVVCELMSRPLPRDRPLWCFHLIDNYQGGSALMGRLHHAIGDGIALTLVLLSLADRTPTPPSHQAADSPELNPFSWLLTRGRAAIEVVRAHAEELMPEGMKLLMQPVEALARTNWWVKGLASVEALTRLTVRRPDPPTVFKGPLGVSKRAAWSRSLPLAEVKALASRLGGNLNDVLLTAVTGGLRRYLVGRGQRPEGLNFRAVVPVNLRPLERMAELGNQFGLVFLSLPVGVADPARRLAELRRRLRALKRSAEPLVAFQVLRALGTIPLALQRAAVALFATKATAVVTSVPGPCQSLYLAGRRLSSIFFWVPQAGRVGLGVSILSYAGEVRLGIATDAGLVPDPEAIVEGFYRELEAMQG
jgi:WS/DGAT/MGAT family acyltransferase